MRRWLRAASGLVPGLGLAVLVLFAGDLWRLLPQAHRFVENGLDLVAAFALISGLYIWTAGLILTALASFLWLNPHGDPLAPIIEIAKGLKRILSGRSPEPRTGAHFLSWLVVVVAVSGALHAALRYLLARYNTASLIALATTGMLAGILLGAVLLRPLLSVLLQKLARYRPFSWLLTARTVLFVIAVATLSLAVYAVLAERRIFKELDGYQLYVPVLALVLGCGFVGHRPFHPRSQGRAVQLLVAGLLLAVALAGLGLAPDNRRARALVATSARSAATLLRGWSMLFDVDNDGVSSVLGGGDCAAWDAYIYPGAVEIPDNGIDEDCLDGDLLAPAARPDPIKLSHPAWAVAQPDLVLISIDTCRRDALGVYGASPRHSPKIDAWAQKAWVFDDAWATASWTMPSLVALMTGRLASELPGFWGQVHNHPVPEGIGLLTTPLHKAGYLSVAVTSGLRLDQLGLERGFEDWRNLGSGWRTPTAQAVMDTATEILHNTAADQPLLLWLHLIDVHDPYHASPEHRLFGNDERGRYAAAIRQVDSLLPQLLQALEDSGRRSRAVVALFSDHGEAFGEHGHRRHGHSVYAEEIRVPLIIEIPGETGGRVTGPVSLIDLAPTLWDLAGVDPGSSMRGRGGMSLAPVMLDGREISKRFVIAEQTVRTREFALVTPDYAWRWDQTRRRSELFDRRQDPLQQNNLARKLPHIAEKMHRKLLTELAPVRYLAGKKLGQVLLRELPVDMHVARVAFVDGPVLEGYRATAKNRQLRLELFFRPRSIAQGTRYKVAVRIKDPSGAIIGQSSDYVTKGVYPPPRWRTVDRVRHVGRIKLSRDLPRGSSLCVEMKVDQRRLAIEAAGSGRACVGLRFADDL